MSSGPAGIAGAPAAAFDDNVYICVGWLSLVLAFITVVLRFWARRIQGIKYASNDYILIVALVRKT